MRNFDKSDFEKSLDRLCGVLEGSSSVSSNGLQVEEFVYYYALVLVVVLLVVVVAVVVVVVK